MRYQERIYIQNDNGAVRNRDLLNVNMSSDICVFNNPMYVLSGASKINCCVCPDTLVGHDTYSGGTVILPTTVTWNDCEDPLTIIRASINQAMIAFSISGETALPNFIEVEELNCGRIIKWKSNGGNEEAWTVNQIDGTFDNYFILDYTNTQNTIHKSTIIGSGDGYYCCDNQYASAYETWNNFLNTITLTGNINYYLDVPYTSATSCNVTKTPCTTGSTGTTYIISANTQTIPFTFDFTGNTSSFTANSATFKYEIYKYNTDAGMFYVPPVYKSETIEYSAFSGTNSIVQSLPISGLSMDGEYLVKGYFNYNVCTEFMGKLGKTVDTLQYRGGLKYGLYNGNEDYFFRAIKAAETPIFQATASNTTTPTGLNQLPIFPDAGINSIVIPINIVGQIILTLNGLVLTQDYDYTVNGNIITLSGQTVEDDIITVISGTDGAANNLQGDSILVGETIASGPTDSQGSNRAYLNTTTGKYEIYTNVTPSVGNKIVVMLNGATLADGVDYYQSVSNLNRIILEGDLQSDDIVTIVYYAQTNVVNGLITNTPTVAWTVKEAPQAVNGIFSLEVSTGSTFSDFYYSGNTPYTILETQYTDTFIASGAIGTTLYYRVKNSKNYITLCGDVVNSIAYSEIIPIVIQTNAINSY